MTQPYYVRGDKELHDKSNTSAIIAEFEDERDRVQEAFEGAHTDIVAGAALPGTLVYIGDIAAPANFPTATGVRPGWLYRITADVTDNDPTKTNTGLSFSTGDEIFWIGSTWLSSALPLPVGMVTAAAILASDQIPVGDGARGIATGGLNAADVSAIISAAPMAGSHSIWVDKFRSDTYTEDGSALRPYKTVQAAVNRIASIAVPSQDWTILIQTGSYVENVVLENTGLYMLSLVGVGGVVAFNPASGNSLQSISNNANLSKLRLYNIEFPRPVVITGPAGGTCFTDVWVDGCKFPGTGSITLTCINNWSMMSCYSEGAITITNVPWFYVDSQRMNGAFFMTYDDTASIPSWGLGSPAAFFNGVYLNTTATLTKVGAALGNFIIVGSKINSSSGTITVPVGWALHAYNSFIRGNLVNSGTFLQRGSFVEKVFTNIGTWTNDTKSSMLGYTPVVAGNWVPPAPTHVQDTLERIATAVVALQSGAPIA